MLEVDEVLESASSVISSILSFASCGEMPISERAKTTFPEAVGSW